MSSKGLECKFSLELDSWTIDVPYGLPDHQVSAIKDYLKKAWSAVLAQLSPAREGDRVTYVKLALKALDEGRIVQTSDSRNGVDLFKATVGTGKIISLSGASHHG